MRVIILAAGKGTRMGLDLPKVLAPFAGRTMIEHVLEHVFEAGVDAKPVLVVGYKADEVRKAVASYPVEIVEQKEQLGTGHAVMACQGVVNPDEDLMVLYGDHPLVQPSTIGSLADEHDMAGATITLMTYTVPNFEVYGGTFTSFGRILRGADGSVAGIREYKDASEQEKEFKDINPAYYVFSGAWLWQSIHKLEPKNAQKEYYLTDLLTMAIAEGRTVLNVPGEDLREAVGVNTPEQLRLAETMI